MVGIFPLLLLCGTRYISGGQIVRSGTLPNLELIPGSPDVAAAIGQTETIRCLSRGGSLPITYRLLHNMSPRGEATVSEVGGATFSVTIYNHTSLGSYQCVANNSITRFIYSREFSFTLPEPATSHWLILWMRLLIFLNVLLLTLVIILALLRTGWWKP